MSDGQESRGTEVAEPAGVLIRDDTHAYAVPAAVLERYRVAPEQRAGLEADLTGHGGQAPAAEADLYELPTEALAPYRLSDEQRAAIEAESAGQDDTSGFVRYAPNQPKGEPISGYTGYAYSVTFGSLQRDQNRHMVYVGVFPMYQADSSGPYPGLR